MAVTNRNEASQQLESPTNRSQDSEELEASTNSSQALAQLEALANSTLFPGRSKGYNRAVRRAARAAAERLMFNYIDDFPERPEIKVEDVFEADNTVSNKSISKELAEDSEVKPEEPESLVVPVKFEVGRSQILRFLLSFTRYGTVPYAIVSLYGTRQ